MVFPVGHYRHAGNGCSIIGGYVYRGDRFPRMFGVYFYADYCTGKIWGLTRDENDDWVSRELIDTNLHVGITTFGVDEEGELYLATDDLTTEGAIYRVMDTRDRNYLRVVEVGLAGEDFYFSVGTDATRSYRIEWSNDLRDWTPLQTFLPEEQVERTITAIDIGAAGNGVRFYQVVELPE